LDPTRRGSLLTIELRTRYVNQTTPADGNFIATSQAFIARFRLGNLYLTETLVPAAYYAEREPG